MAVIVVNQADFQTQVLEAKVPVLVDFWAPWCGPCKMQEPILEELAHEMGDKIIIAKVNVDENNDLAQQYGIMSIPALKIFKNGELVAEKTGVSQKSELMDLLSQYC